MDLLNRVKGKEGDGPEGIEGIVQAELKTIGPAYREALESFCRKYDVAQERFPYPDNNLTKAVMQAIYNGKNAYILSSENVMVDELRQA